MRVCIGTCQNVRHVGKTNSAGEGKVMAKGQSGICCACGEHYVGAYLSGVGAVVAFTRAGSPATDLIVTSETGGPSISLQVKTGRQYSHVIYKRNPKRNYWVWRVGKKAIEICKESHWYAFVYVGDWPHGKEEEHPKVFFVPSKVVVKRLRAGNKSQREWFWMRENAAKQYCGLLGYRRLKRAIDG